MTAKIEAWKSPVESGSVTVMADSVDDNPQDPQRSIADILTNLPAVRAAKKVNTLSRVHRRLITPLDAEQDDGEARLAFQHTVFCQTSLPYRNPGDDVRLWERRQGKVILEVQAGRALDPAKDKMVDVGLPWGGVPPAEQFREAAPKSRQFVIRSRLKRRQCHEPCRDHEPAPCCRHEFSPMQAYASCRRNSSPSRSASATMVRVGLA